jgi:hypothetical protein
MNKRIKELATEARLLTGWPVGEVEYQKFAELIVRECLVVINQSNGVGDDDVIKISMDVKEHFGVEK